MNFNDFSPSLQLLIILCKPEWSEFDIEFIEKHRSEDQTILLKLADRHRVSSLVWTANQKLHLFSVPNANTLENNGRENQLRALQSKALQTKLLVLMKEKGINGVFLKGTSIAERFYQDVAERHVLDLDLWVGEGSIKLMTEELCSLGFEPFPNILDFTRAQWNFFIATHHDIYFSAIGDRYSIPIELHWQLRSSFGGFDFNPDGPMHSYDEFLYLCVHGTEHGWFRLKWLMDIPRIIVKSNFDWNGMRRRAIELNCLKHFEITLLVLDRLRVLPLPNLFNSSINPDSYKYQLKYILKVLGSDSYFNDTDKNRANYYRYLWTLSRNKWNGKFILNFLTSPNDWKTISLPSSLFFLYFLLRPFIWAYRRVR